MTDPRETVKCACPRIDGKDCISWRYNTERNYDGDDEECSCPCHDIYEDSLREDDE